MIDYIRSNTLRRYLKQVGFTISERDIASLIINSLLVHGEAAVINSLEELMKATKDAELQNMLRAYIGVYNNNLYLIQNSGDNIVFYLESVYAGTDDEYQDMGLYRNYKDAFEVGKRYGEDFYIHKKRLFLNANPIRDRLLPDCVDSEIGRICFKKEKQFEVYCLENYEHNTDEEIENYIMYLTDHFLAIPHPFRKGQLVKTSDGLMGIVNAFADDKELEDYFHKALDSEYDVFTNEIFVEILEEDGMFEHGHYAPTDLEVIEPDEIENEMVRNILEAGSKIILGEGNLCVLDFFRAGLERNKK